MSAKWRIVSVDILYLLTDHAASQWGFRNRLSKWSVKFNGYWRRNVLVTFLDVCDRFNTLKNHEHNERSRQHIDSLTNILNFVLCWWNSYVTNSALSSFTRFHWNNLFSRFSPSFQRRFGTTMSVTTRSHSSSTDLITCSKKKVIIITVAVVILLAVTVTLLVVFLKWCSSICVTVNASNCIICDKYSS